MQMILVLVSGAGSGLGGWLVCFSFQN